MLKSFESTLKLARNKPIRSKLKGISRKAGRNNLGRITVRHQGGGVKQSYRIIDWARTLSDGVVTNLEYDPNRSIYLARLTYPEKEKDLKKSGGHSYILAPKGLKVFDRLQVISKDTKNFLLRTGDVSPLSKFEFGDFVHCVEAIPNQGALYARSAGTFCQVLQVSSTDFVKLKLPSGSHRLFSPLAKATYGILSNEYHNLRNIEKAGRSRWLNKRPSVRGVAMNPIDHPHGGGQGKTKGGRPSVTPNSWPTKGQPTRSARKKNSLILTPRQR